MRNIAFCVLMLLGQSVSAAIATTSSITVRWTAPGDNGTTGRASLYDLRYSKVPITDANWATATQAISEPKPANAGTLQTCTVTGLTPTTTYYFRLKTTDSHGNVSALSNQAVAATCGGTCSGTTGNTDCSLDGNVDMSDLAVLIAYLFLNDPPACWCIYEGNVDGSAPSATGPTIDVSDLTYMLDYLFRTFTPLPPCR